MQTPIVNKNQDVYNRSTDEKILVLKRERLFPDKAVQGFVSIDFAYYQLLIETHGQFEWRSQMEVDPNYKQIIPYLVFNHNNTYFLMKRSATGGEKRLQNMCTFGIGGHVRQGDMKGKSIIDWARREFAEEVNFKGHYSVHPLGMINDDRNDVGRVHVGFVFLLKGDSPAISIRSELKEGNLVTLEQAAPYYDQMEGWSQLVFDCCT